MRWNDAYGSPSAPDGATALGSTGLDDWRIIDLGSIVIHLMSRRARKFYELERLYSMAAAVPVS
jgi:ribosomal silencing factor RsfS